MTRHDDQTRLRHMLDHAREAVALADGKTAEDIQKERVLQLALVRLIEVVGEAASRVSDQAQSQYPAIPWRQAAGMRNRLIHGYDAVDMKVLWDTIREDLPALISILEGILPQT